MSNSDLSVEDLGAELGLGRVQLYRKTKSLTGYAPNELLRIARLKRQPLCWHPLKRRWPKLPTKWDSVLRLTSPGVIKTILEKAPVNS